MKSQLIKLNNKLNRKRIEFIDIQGTCDKFSRIKQQFKDLLKYDDEYNYYVTLSDGHFSLLFPNIVKDKNDKFYYWDNDVLITLKLTKGAYEVKAINAIIQHKIPNESIKLVVDQGSARCKSVLK